ncbi:hypothetical protein N7474_000832 [Penicillium riverlandense]|uniref:uncharacterized protein n=1 Tax=Penicillium riverlandense TaxID=1903569 RepID=UPI002548C0D7|nr:uncharacterized protein N7474_000832 [Penicillium riverlandense]KAJ5832521.1 hypothetical protein N7474_000832 [Penicillium riverlandense]
MPSSKTDTSLRFPEADEQKRRLRNVTQDQKSAARSQAQTQTGQQKSESSTTWGPEQLLSTHMNSSGDPVPDPVSFGNGSKAKKNKVTDEDADLFEAMTAEFD